MLRESPSGPTTAAPRAALLVVGALIGALAGCGAAADTARPPGRAGGSPVAITVPGEADHRPPRSARDGLTLADGEVPAGTTVLDDSVPAVARLDDNLRTALHAAATDAAHDGLELDVNSGWRSVAYQRDLFTEAVAKYGSEDEAARWVARPGTSVHEAGEAVDLGPAAATAWLAEHGAAYGLCRVYANEPWHFELRPAAPTQGCPATYADAAHDPRMQQ